MFKNLLNNQCIYSILLKGCPSNRMIDLTNALHVLLISKRLCKSEFHKVPLTCGRDGKKQPGICGDVHTQQWKGVAREKCAAEHVWLVHDIDVEHFCSEFCLLHQFTIKKNKSRFLFSFCIAVSQCCFKWAYYLQEMGYKNNDFLWQSFVKNKIKSDQNWYPIRFSPFASKPLWQPIICEYELGC